MRKSKQVDSSRKTKPVSWKEAPFTYIKGFLMGSSDIVPGVSGGTMALILGIYERLLNAISGFNGTFFKRVATFKIGRAFGDVQWRFLSLLVLGIASAALFFTKLVPLQVYMFTDPELIFGLFFGLIVGSILILAKAIDHFSWRHALMIVFGTILGFYIVTLVPTQTPENPFFIFFSGFIAICAMILPGISGSYILLILRKYDYLLSQIGKLGSGNSAEAIWVLLPFFAGAVCGLLAFSRVLSWLLDRFKGLTFAVLVGFLIGSLYVIWPYQNRYYQEFVTKKESIAYNSSKARKLREHPSDEQLPEFERLGKRNKSAQNGDTVQLQTVKKKLIKSEPFIPYLTAKGMHTNHFWVGIAGMIVGLTLVGGLDYLRDDE